MDEQDFEDALMDLIDEAAKHGIDPDAIISAMELRIMALKEKQG